MPYRPRTPVAPANPAMSGGQSSLPPQPGANNSLSAYGVNVTPPSPISYALPKNPGNISDVISSVQTGQNQANAANQERYGQLLGVLNAGATGQNQNYNTAMTNLMGGYGQAQGALSGALGNDQTIMENEQNRLGQQAQQAYGAATQNTVSRGIGNTTVAGAMQDQVTRAANDASANIVAQKAKADNSVYSNIASLYANQGNSAANLQAQTGNAYMQGAGAIGSAIQGRTDQAPSISDYAPYIAGAAAAQQQGKTKTSVTMPDTSAIGMHMNGMGGGGGGATAAGQGGFTSGSQSGGGNFAPGMSPGSGVYSGPDAGKTGTGYNTPQMAPVAPITQGSPGVSTGSSGIPGEGSADTTSPDNNPALASLTNSANPAVMAGGIGADQTNPSGDTSLGAYIAWFNSMRDSGRTSLPDYNGWQSGQR